jgi:hypothetical protein
MNKLNKYNLAPLVLAHCIEFLRQRPENTKYHPKKNQFFLDSKMMARIIRHKGDFKATVKQDETSFFGQLQRVLISMETIESPIRKESFEVEENTNFNKKAIDVYTSKRFNTFKGRKIEFRSKKYEPING